MRRKLKILTASAEKEAMSGQTRIVQLNFFLIHTGSGNFVQIVKPFTIGRETGDATYPADDRMSRSHFRVFLQGNQCLIEDLGSTNKTLVNGMVLEPRTPVPLSFGSEIVAGGQKFVLNREARIPEAAIVVPVPVGDAPLRAAGPGKTPVPATPILTLSEVFAEMGTPSNWGPSDISNAAILVLNILVMTALVLTPHFSHPAWLLGDLDLIDTLTKTLFVPLFVFWCGFSGFRRHPRLATLASGAKNAYIAGLALFFGLLFAMDQGEWRKAANLDIQRSCFTEASRSRETCKSAILAAEKIDLILKKSRALKLAPVLKDEPFLSAYLEKYYPDFDGRLPASEPGN